MSDSRLWLPIGAITPFLPVLLLAAFCGCNDRHATSLNGTWHATKVKWIQNGNEFQAATIDVAEHGSALLTLRSDSTYEVRAEILKDITAERTILGKDVTETLVPAIFRTYRTGNFVLKDSVLDLLAQDQSIFVRGVFQLWDDDMTITFEDSHHQRWWSSWKHS